MERLGVRGNRAEQREMAGAVAGDGSARARLDPCARKEKGTGTRSIQARERIRATQRGWRGSPARATRGVAGGRRSMGADTVTNRETTVGFNEF